MNLPRHSPHLLIVIPTVQGREDHLTRCLAAYEATLPPGVCGITVRFRTYHDMATCGEAWNLGAELARDLMIPLLHLSADDLEPHPGWYESALAAVSGGVCPSPLIYGMDGVTVESHGTWGPEVHPDGQPVPMTRIPFLRTEWWRSIPPIHYYSDNAVTSTLMKLGVPIQASPGFAFTHHWAAAYRHPMMDEQWHAECARWEAYHHAELRER